MFESHLAKENELVLPLLAADPAVSVAGLLGGMHELLGGHHDHAGHSQPETERQGGCGGHCSCGEVDGEEYPELDARTVPHAIRHATIFGALEAVAPGGGMVLVAPHEPLPLLAQLEDRGPPAVRGQLPGARPGGVAHPAGPPYRVGVIFRGTGRTRRIGDLPSDGGGPRRPAG